MKIYNDPGLLYDEQVSNWQMLPDNLKKEFGDIEFNISNSHMQEDVPYTPVISATISMPLSYISERATSIIIKQKPYFLSVKLVKYKKKK